MNGWFSTKVLHKLRHKRVKIWQLIVVFLLLLAGSVFTLRHNNLKMVELRSAVIEADVKGVGVSESIEELNSFIFNHMNTRVVRPIELVNTYNRQAEAVVQAAQKGSGRDIYAEGTAACERRGIPLSSIAQCIAQYASENASAVTAQKITLPDKNRFTYSFVSPVWTPDVAGFFTLSTVVVLAWLLVRIGEFIIVRLVVRHRLKNGL